MSELNVGTLNVATTSFTGDNSTLTSAPATDIDAILGAGSTDQVLKYDGSNWVAATVPPKSGSVVQVQDYVYPSPDDQYVSISGDTDYDTPITVTITPQYADSKLLVDGCAHIRANGAFGMSLYVKRDGSKINPSLQRGSLDFMYKGESRNHHMNMRVNTSVPATSTSATTFTIGVTPYSGGGGNGEWNRGWGHNYIRITEVKG
jgi:hypothetical protein